MIDDQIMDGDGMVYEWKVYEFYGDWSALDDQSELLINENVLSYNGKDMAYTMDDYYIYPEDCDDFDYMTYATNSDSVKRIHILNGVKDDQIVKTFVYASDLAYLEEDLFDEYKDIRYIYNIGNILDATKLVEKTTTEAHIEERYVLISNVITEITTSGTIDGEKVNGTMYLDPDDLTIYRIIFYIHEHDFDSLYEYLNQLYEQPVNEGEEPYAADNGGAVQYAVYDDGNGISIRIEQGSLNDSAVLTISKKG